MQTYIIFFYVPYVFKVSSKLKYSYIFRTWRKILQHTTVVIDYLAVLPVDLAVFSFIQLLFINMRLYLVL